MSFDFRGEEKSLRPTAERAAAGWRLDRRHFLSGTMASAVALGSGELFAGWFDRPRLRDLIGCSQGDPLGCIREHNHDVLIAFLDAQFYCYFAGQPEDDPVAASEDVLRYAAHMPSLYQQGLCGALAVINFYAHRQTRRRFAQLPVVERIALLNQGEFRPGELGQSSGGYPLVTWDQNYILHTAVSGLALVTRLITNSRRPAQARIGMLWSAPCRRPENLVRLDPPPYPDLDVEYDVCIVGSGAGGAVMAARAAEAGQRVLIVEQGDWVSPDALVQRVKNAKGQIEVHPARCDDVLMRLYKGAGANVAGGLSEVIGNRLDLAIPWRRKRIQPQQSINLLQAQVVGGGPYVNNAIFTEISPEAWNRWSPRQPSNLTYDLFAARMREVKRDLGVNTVASRDGAGARSLIFAEGCRKAGDEVSSVPVAIRPESAACGSDNSADPFGQHVGGLHPVYRRGPNSYLMRALTAQQPAEVAYRLQARHFEIVPTKHGTLRTDALWVEDRRATTPGAAYSGGIPDGCGPMRKIRARQFVVAAGAAASTNLLRASAESAGVSIPGLGERFTANVGAPVYAVFDQPITRDDVPEPGVTQCFFVPAKNHGDPEPILENWFHFPGTVALAVTGWFQDYARMMNNYNHISMAGMVVPTKVRPANRIKPDGNVHLELDDEEFDLILRGMKRIGEIYLAAGTPDNGVTVYLPTKGILLDPCGQPLVIRDQPTLHVALAEVRQRGAPFVNLITSHLQGGNSLGVVVNRDTFRVHTASQGDIDNLYLADGSLFPAGCEINPQLTIKALAMFAADRLLENAAAVA